MSKKKGQGEIPGLAPGPVLGLRRELCRGCTHCLRVCPTEAIRIRQGKAEVMAHRCIQCGECIRVCPRGAWVVVAGDSLSEIKKKAGQSWAVLDPAVLGQFGGHTSPLRVMRGFGEIGFSLVKEMGEGLKIYRRAVSNFLSAEEPALPAISSDCPAVVQLVQVKFPSLLENLIPVIPPYEIMATRVKRESPEDLKPSLYYIVPCLAKAQAAIRPFSPEGGFSGAIPLADLYNDLKASLNPPHKANSFPMPEEGLLFGLEWAFPGGESQAVGVESCLTVDGIHNVADVLELAENGLLGDVPFIEAWSCPGGCLGGALNVQNPFFARYHLLSWIRDHPSSPNGSIFGGNPWEEARFRWSQPLSPREGMRLDEDLRVAMEKLRCIDAVVKRFPGIDCGSCGCPNCLALAEDVVQGHASEKDCLYVLKGAKAASSEGKEGSCRWKYQKPPGKRRRKGSPLGEKRR